MTYLLALAILLPLFVGLVAAEQHLRTRPEPTRRPAAVARRMHHHPAGRHTH